MALRFIEERGIRAVHMGNDEVNHWWRARTAATVEQATAGDDGVSLTAECDWHDGYVVVIPVSGGEVTAEVDDAPAEAEVREEFGRHWAYVALDTGRHEVQISG